MAKVIIALGSNIGDREKEIEAARTFLKSLACGTIVHAPVYETEPIGPSTSYYYNTVTKLEVDTSPFQLVELLKRYERESGRKAESPRWSDRNIDLDIIAFGDLILKTDHLIIPHSNYRNRLFVLVPLRDIQPDWRDPETGESIEDLIVKAPDMEIERLKYFKDNERSTK